jgi:hypothetical protein
MRFFGREYVIQFMTNVLLTRVTNVHLKGKAVPQHTYPGAEE